MNKLTVYNREQTDKLIIAQDATIREAVRVIEQGALRIGFQVNEAGKLLGVVTAGDILRLLSRGADLNDPVRAAVNPTPVVLKETDPIESTFDELGHKIMVIPRVDQSGKLMGFVDTYSAYSGFFNIRKCRVVIVGLGYVGLTLAVVLAEHGFTVTGYDINLDLIEKIKKKKSPFYEKGIENYLTRYVGKSLNVSSSLEPNAGDIYFITVGTPIDRKTRRPELKHVTQASEKVGSVLKKGDLVILRSTVPLTASRGLVVRAIEKTTELQAGKDFYFAYCPERTTEGQAITELKHLPQIVGGYDAVSARLASRLFSEHTPSVITVSSLEAAELSKLLDNTFRDVMFAYANQMIEICEFLKLDLSEIIDAANLNYARNQIPKPSPGVGGPCLSKDPHILMSVFEQFKFKAPLLEASRKINERVPTAIVERIAKQLSSVKKSIEDAKVFIIGFAFKGNPETSDLRESTTLWFLEELRKYTARIDGYDSVVRGEELEKLGVRPVAPEEGFKGADVVCIMNNHPSHEDIHVFELLNTVNKPAVFFDGWHMFQPDDIRSIEGVIYAGVGVG